MSDELTSPSLRPGTPVPGSASGQRAGQATQGQEGAQAPPGYYGSAYGGYSDYGYGYYSGESETHDTVMSYIRTVYRHRRMALVTWAAILVAVAVYTFTRTPVYEARVQLLIEPDNPNVISFADVLQEKATNEYYQTQYTILKSRSLAKRTIDALKFWDNPELVGPANEAAANGKVNEGVVSRVAGWFGGGEAAAKTASDALAVPAIGETSAQTRAIDGFLKLVTVSPIRNSRLVDVSFASTDPKTAALVTNTLAQQYIEQNLEYKFSSTRQAADWLEGQLEEQRKKLEASEQALQRYREQGNAVALEDRQNIVVQRLSDLSTAYTEARTARIEKEALYNQLVSLQTTRGALDSFPAILSNTFIQGLKTQLTDLQRQQAQMGERLGANHPDMIKLASAIETTQARIDGEIGKVVQSVRSEFLAAQAQERSLADELERQKEQALALNRSGIEYSVLKREAESNQQIYDAIMQRAKETGISGELKASNIRVVDQAQEPRSPVRPRKLTNMALGLMGGLMAALGLVFLMDNLDSRIKDPDEIQARLGMPFLGIVPLLDEKEASGDPLLDTSTPAHFAEAFRTIRTHLIFSSEEAHSRTVVVTSTQPAEGKTIVTANLALALAQTGQRVVLIDSDMRRPRQHQVFGVKDTGGLASVLAGATKLSQAVQHTNRKGLWILPAGPPPSNSAELLGSERFKQVLKALREHFDWIVIDSPPIMAVADAAVISHLATGVLFVVGCEQTSRHLAQRAVRQLTTAKATFLGAVLNRVNLKRNPYYYSHYYRHEYAKYYRSADESASR